MVDKRALQSALITVTNAVDGAVSASACPADMRRYIYKVKTANQYAGANQLTLGYKDSEGDVHILDYIDHATEHEMWNDPDELREDALPLYIIPASCSVYGKAGSAGNIYLYILYEDAE